MRPPRRAHAGLLALNAALLAAVALVTLQPGAFAQPGARVPGRYAMVAGAYTGGSGDAIYILDTANHEMITLRWDPGQRALQGIGYRSVARDLAEDPGR